MTIQKLSLIRIAGLAGLALIAGAVLSSPRVLADDDGRPLHITKDCSTFTGQAGQYCTIKTSNVPAIPPNSRVYYDQAAGIPAGLLDSNVVLDAGDGNRAVGRCTLDLSTGSGLCSFTDGTGTLAGFSARINVSYVSGATYAWNGSYGFGTDQ